LIKILSSRPVFWTVLFSGLFLAAYVALDYESLSSRQLVALNAMALLCFLFVLGMWRVGENAWAVRAGTGVIFLSCFAFFIVEFVRWRVSGPSEDGGLGMALECLLAYGLPCLFFSIRGWPRGLVAGRDKLAPNEEAVEAAPAPTSGEPDA